MGHNRQQRPPNNNRCNLNIAPGMIIAPYTASAIFRFPSQNNYRNYSLLDMIEPYNLVPQSGHLQDKTANICMIVNFVALRLSGLQHI